MCSSRWLLTTALVLAVVPMACQSALGQTAATKVLFIGKDPDHPWGSHMYMHTCDVLAKCVQQTEGIEAIVSNGWPDDPAILDGVKTIVVYTSPAAEILLDGQGSGKLDELMKQGVGLVTIHWASTVYRKNLDRLGDRWISYLGGTWVSNVGISTESSELKQLDPQHPICRGWSGYELHDEYYLNPIVSVAAEPLLEVDVKGRKLVVGWAYQRSDGGRAYGTTLGHFYRNFQIEAFRQALVNAILWTAHIEVPDGGAPVKLSEAELKLPPRPVPTIRKPSVSRRKSICVGAVGFNSGAVASSPASTVRTGPHPRALSAL